MRPDAPTHHRVDTNLAIRMVCGGDDDDDGEIEQRLDSLISTILAKENQKKPKGECFRINANRWFVEDEKPRLVKKRKSERESPLLPAA